MTLGSIFSKLSGITLRNIAKWYGIGVLVILVAVIAGFFALTIAQILWAIVTALGFWGTLVMACVITGLIAANHFKDEIFPDDGWSERYLREKLMETQRSVDEQRHESPYNFSTASVNDGWMNIHKLILGMKDGETCDIHAPDGTVHHCADKYEALKVYEELWGARKTE